MLTGPFLIPDTQTLKLAIILLHGFGSDGQDLFSLVPYLERSLPAGLQQQVAYFSPNGPSPTPFMMGYQWFSDKDWTFRDKPGIDAAGEQVRAYIQKNVIEDLGLNWRQVVVLGFSQGGMTALHAVPQWPEELGGLIGHSTRLMWPDSLPQEATQTPVLLLHGTADDVVGADSMVTAANKLEEHGVKVEQQLIPGLGHGLDGTSIEAIVRFVEARF